MFFLCHIYLFILHGTISILFIQFILNFLILCVPAVICFIALPVKENLGNFKWPQSNISAHPLNNNNKKPSRCTSLPGQLIQILPNTGAVLFFWRPHQLSYLLGGFYFLGCALRRSWRNPGCRSYCIQEAPFWSPLPRKQGDILMPYYRWNHAPVCSSSEAVECWAYAVV